VVAAAYVAAHNFVLRAWLRGAGEGDPMPALDAAFDGVAARLRDDLPPAADGPPGSAAVGTGSGPSVPGPSSPSTDADDVVVAVFRSGESIDDVVERISRSL
jgi:hypothetical protein